MRVNKYIASCTGLSRRAADNAISSGRVQVNGLPPSIGQDIGSSDIVTLDGQTLQLPTNHTTILFHKPVGYVVSRTGQGSKTIYDLLPKELHSLKAVGRLDKDSSGLLLLTDDGQLANRMTHPRFAKEKVYTVVLDKPLSADDRHVIEQGVVLHDGPSRLQLAGKGREWMVTMSEGRNRQIRRTFEAQGYRVAALHRVQFGPYQLEGLDVAKYQVL